MSPPRILVIGKNGQVGWESVRTLQQLGKVCAVGRPELDLANPDSIRQTVRSARPNVILNAGAYTSVDRAESEAELAHRVNGLAPGVLAEEAKALGALLVHYSTDYVFDGSKPSPYLETDGPNPVSVYGRSKLAGEQAVQAVGGPHLIFRLSWVYAARGKNFLLTIVRLAGERETLRVVNDQIGSPTWSRPVAEATAQVLAHVLSARDSLAFTGLYHLAASGQTSWHGFAEAIVQRLPADRRRCRTVEAIPTSEYPTPARRPSYSVLACDKLERNFHLRLLHWRTSVEAVLDDVLAQPVG
jgi:dTDP-4-dehydrorhamnose reductase